LKPATQLNGALLVACAALLYSAKAVFVKLAYRHGVDPVSLMTLRMLFSFPVYLFVAIASIRRSGNQNLNVSSLLGIGVLGLLGYYAASFLDLSGLQYITANLERLILYIYPSLVVLISVLLLGKPIRRAEILCLAGAYAGIALVFGTDLTIYNEETVVLTGNVELPAVLWGGLLVLGSAITFAFYLVGSEQMMRRFTPTLFTSLAMLVSTAGICFHYLLTKPPAQLLTQPLPVYGWAFAIAILSTVIPSYMMSVGIARIGAARASIIGSVGPVSTMIMGYLFLAEIITLIHLLGLAIVITCSITLGRLRQ
jgi:drug/metabolite transporter (DMT)-like permease